MILFRIALGLSLGVSFSCAIAAEDVISPGANLIVDGIPPLPAALAGRIAAYTEFRGQRFVGWHPSRREMLIARRAEATTQIFELSAPGAIPRQLTRFSEPVGSAQYPQPARTGEPVKADPGYFLFARDEGGNERYQIHRFDLATGAATALTDPNKRAGSRVSVRGRETLFYSAVATGRQVESSALSVEIRAVEAPRPDSDRLIARLPGIGWSLQDVSPDGRSLAISEYRSANESYVWLLDLESGASATRRLLTPSREGAPASYRGAAFDATGREIITLSDRDSEFTRLIAIDVQTRAERVLAGHDWGIVGFDLSDDGKHLAYLTNEDGLSVLRVIDLATGLALPLPPVPPGIVSGVQWRPRSSELAFTLSGHEAPAAIHSIDLASGRLERWTHEPGNSLSTKAFAAPELIRWKSFDDRTISGFAYQPPSRFEGPRPVFIDIHGGPESQARPGFLGRMNYLINELGIAVIYPNVRGSSGYGKRFLELDDGRLREDSVRDIGALLDWIGRDKRFDPRRVMVSGGSYGGYMSLATAVRHGDRITCAIDEVGIANFVSFLERTESYRRDLRRVEYGDERDPEMRAFLSSISPLHQADRIKKPLFVIHGENDPRVPVAEANSIVGALKKNGTPVWSLIARDEGHGFAKKRNADFLFYATVAFVERCLGDAKKPD